MLTFWSTIQMHTFVSIIFHILSFGLLSLHCQCVMDQMQLKIRPSISSVLWIAIFTQHPLQCDCHNIHYKSKLCNQNCFFFAFCKQLLGTNIIIRERGHFCKSICSSFAFEIEKKISVPNLVLESGIWNGQILVHGSVQHDVTLQQTQEGLFFAIRFPNKRFMSFNVLSRNHRRTCPSLLLSLKVATY